MRRPLVLIALTAALAFLLGGCQRETPPGPEAAATIPALVATQATATPRSTLVAQPATTLAPLPTVPAVPAATAVGRPAPAATARPAIVASPTDTQYIRFLINVNLRGGPGVNYPRLGQIFAGQTAKVTGVSADKGWWRILCLDGSTGNCWVSADPKLTQPTAPPR
jgi:uncharacterized protein YgiM (DUF1202 family)